MESAEHAFSAVMSQSFCLRMTHPCRQLVSITTARDRETTRLENARRDLTKSSKAHPTVKITNQSNSSKSAVANECKHVESTQHIDSAVESTITEGKTESRDEDNQENKQASLASPATLSRAFDTI